MRSSISKFTNNIFNLLKNTTIENKNLDDIDHYYRLITDGYNSISYNITEDFSQMLKIDDNVENCDSVTIFILDQLYNNHTKYLDDFIETLDNDSKTNKRLYEFIKNIKNIDFDTCINWINLYGTNLMRGLYRVISNNMLPEDIKSKITIKSSDIYGNFTSLDIQKYIESYIDRSRNINLTYKDSKFNLTLNTNKNYKIQNIDNLIKRCLLLSFLEDKNDKITLRLWFTKLKKKLPKGYKKLGPKEINSGASGYDVSIWRLEEMDKLVMHEIIHNLQLDLQMHDFKIVKFIKDNYSIGKDAKILINECYTETWACIVNCIVCVLELKSNKKMLYDFITLERKYALYQIAKIFIHYGFNSSKDFFKTTHNRHLFKQSTSVFSYFIAKGSLLYNIDKFLNFARSNCDVIKIKKGSENNFEILLKYCLEDPQFQKAIDYYINFIKKQKKKY